MINNWNQLPDDLSSELKPGDYACIRFEGSTLLEFVQQSRPEYRERQAQSPNVRMFFKADEQG